MISYLKDVYWDIKGWLQENIKNSFKLRTRQKQLRCEPSNSCVDFCVNFIMSSLN